MRYIRLGQHSSTGCPVVTSPCADTMYIGEVELFTASASADYIDSTSTTTTADSSAASHGDALPIDGSTATWWESGSSGTSASLELDLGASAPFYDELGYINVFNR